MPDGMPFVAESLRRGQLTRERANALLADSRLRVSMLQLLLTSATAPPWALELVVAAVTTEDFRRVETLVLRQELSDAQLTALLTRPTRPVRALVAVAVLVGNLHDDEQWSPGALEPVWTQALDGLELLNRTMRAGHPQAPTGTTHRLTGDEHGLAGPRAPHRAGV